MGGCGWERSIDGFLIFIAGSLPKTGTVRLASDVLSRGLSHRRKSHRRHRREWEGERGRVRVSYNLMMVCGTSGHVWTCLAGGSGGAPRERERGLL